MPPSNKPPEPQPDPQDAHVGSTSTEERSGAHKEPSDAEVLAEASAIYPDTSPGAPTAAEIAAEAYAIFLNRGSRHGQDVDHWFEAERLLRAKRAAAHATASNQTASPRQQESTRGHEEEDDRPGAVGERAAGIEPQKDSVARREESGQNASAARGTPVPESGGQHAGSGQVQRRDDPQAPKAGSQASSGQEAKRQEERVEQERPKPPAEKPLPSARDGKEGPVKPAR